MLQLTVICFTYGLMFRSPQGAAAPAPPSAPAGGCPPPPPPGPPPPMESSGAGGEDGSTQRNALFDSINKGFDITKGR